MSKLAKQYAYGSKATGDVCKCSGSKEQAKGYKDGGEVKAMKCGGIAGMKKGKK